MNSPRKEKFLSLGLTGEQYKVIAKFEEFYKKPKYFRKPKGTKKNKSDLLFDFLKEFFDRYGKNATLYALDHVTELHFMGEAESGRGQKWDLRYIGAIAKRASREVDFVKVKPDVGFDNKCDICATAMVNGKCPECAA